MGLSWTPASRQPHRPHHGAGAARRSLARSWGLTACTAAAVAVLAGFAGSVWSTIAPRSCWRRSRSSPPYMPCATPLRVTTATAASLTGLVLAAAVAAGVAVLTAHR